jgi:hypothetical protein
MVKTKHDKEHDSKQIESNQGKRASGHAAEKISKDKPKSESPVSPAVMALKELKVTAFSNVFLPRTVSRTVGHVSKGMPMPKGRALPVKTHPMFGAQEEEVEEEPAKTHSTPQKVNKEEKSRFDKEIDKVFNAKSSSKEKGKKEKGSWTRVWPEESPKKEKETPVESKEQDQIEIKNTKDKEIEDKKVTEDSTAADTKDVPDDKKSEKEQKKERKEKRKKEKEEKSKRKKGKKEKKEKKVKESDNLDTLGNDSSKEKILGENNEAQAVLDSNTSEQLNQKEFESTAYVDYNETYQEYPEGGYEYHAEAGQEQGWYDENGVYHDNQEEEYYYYYDQEGNIVGYEGPEGYVEGNPFEVCEQYFLLSMIYMYGLS